MEPVALTPLAPIASKEDFIERFGDWIEGLFHKSEDIYNSLTDAEKKAAVWGSGLISVANTYVNAAPSELWAVIQAKFPDITENVVHGFLDELRNHVDNLQSEIPLTLLDALAWLQAYLKQYHSDHNVLNAISTNAYNILTILLSPTTPIEKVISIGVYVYHLIVKPHVQGTAVPTGPVDLPPAPTPPAVDNTAPAQTGSTPTANTPDKAPAELVDAENPPADNPPATDADMQISNEAAASLASASESAPDQPEGIPVDEPIPTAEVSDYHKKNQGEGVDIAPPVAEAAPEALPETISEQPAEVDPATLTPGTDAFQAAVDAEVAKRLAAGNA